MILSQRYTGCLSQAAYLVGDDVSGEAIVIDPLRDIDQYLADAETQGLRIVGVVLTHFHADFVAGHLELAAATGAWIGLGDRARPEFDARLFADGDRITLGGPATGVIVEVMTTPGHTPESISLLVYEHPADSVPTSVITGDALFVGDVGRVDLQAIFGADPHKLAIEQHDTIQRKLMGLPDSVKVYPGHGAGSACGRNISMERTSTIGTERLSNPACAPMGVDEFVDYLTTGQAVPPAYFETDAGLNRRVHSLFTPAAAAKVLTLTELDTILARGVDGRDGDGSGDGRPEVTVLDVRGHDEFAIGHLPGSVNVPLVGRFAETAGMFLDVTAPMVVVVSEPGAELEAVTRLGRIGADNVLGVVDGPLLVELAGADRLVEARRMTMGDFAARMPGNGGGEVASETQPFVVDVRSATEHAGGAVPGAISIPLPELARRASELPTGIRIYVHCQSGWRSSVASSWLVSQGFDVADLEGGYLAWQRVSATSPVTSSLAAA